MFPLLGLKPVPVKRPLLENDEILYMIADAEGKYITVGFLTPTGNVYYMGIRPSPDDALFVAIDHSCDCVKVLAELKLNYDTGSNPVIAYFKDGTIGAVLNYKGFKSALLSDRVIATYGNPTKLQGIEKVLYDFTTTGR